MENIFDIFSGGFPGLKKTIGRFAAYTLLFMWTIKKQYESTDEIVTTFFYWFFLVSLVLLVISVIGLVFFRIGYMDYLRADDRLLDDSKERLKDWPIRVGLFNKVGLDMSVAITVFIFTFVTFLVRPFSTQTMLTDKESSAYIFFTLLGLVTIGSLYLCASWKDTYKLIDREVHALDTNKQLLQRYNKASWNIRGFFCHQKFVIVLLICVSLILLVCLQPLSNFIEAHICSK